MSLSILGVGTALPAHSIGQQDAAELAKALCCRSEKEARLLEVLYARTKIRTRGSVLLKAGKDVGLRQDFLPVARTELDRGPTTDQRMRQYAQEVTPLALTAARKALGQSHLTASRITHLITVSCTGFAAPGVDIALIGALGLKRTVGRTHVGFMGCHGAINGLRIATALANSDPAARILLCAVELCSLHFSYGWNAEKVVANGLFADGAAALIGGSDRSGNRKVWRVKATGSFIFQDSEDAMTWRIGDHGFQMTLSNRVPSLIENHLRPVLERWLARQKLSLRKIRSWAIHPGGPRLLSSIAACLNLPEETLAASRAILAEHGNMSSPTLLFILERLRRQNAPKPCLALGFGPGLAAEMALLV